MREKLQLTVCYKLINCCKISKNIENESRAACENKIQQVKFELDPPISNWGLTFSQTNNVI